MNRAKAHNLNVRASMHEQLGNMLLASWLRASAEHFRELDIRTESALDEMPLGVYDDARMGARTDYAHDWYAYEEEYAYNFNGLE